VDGGLRAVRLALISNLESVIFTSDASGASAKSTAAKGGGLIGASAPAQNLKLTILDETISAPTLAVPDGNGTGSITFGYSDAATGTGSYISCVLEQEGAGTLDLTVPTISAIINRFVTNVTNAK
jgi:hypothetical protein